MEEMDLLRKILADISHIPIDEITPTSSVFDDLDIDSLGLIEVFFEIQRAFSVSINPASIEREQIETPLKMMEVLLSVKSGQRTTESLF